jgi:hypothetical protein
MVACLIAIAIILVTNLGADSADYHYVGNVDDCIVCHDVPEADWGSYTNLKLVRCEITTPNSGDRGVVFSSKGTTYDPPGPAESSYADGDTTYDGVCEVCHTLTDYHTNTDDGTTHYDGQYCIRCHSHANEFYHGGDAGPTCMDAECHGYPSHATHFDSTGKGPGIPLTEDGCYVCHAEPDPDFVPTSFNDGEPLATTIVCDACHSPLGAFPGQSGLNDPDVGAKANWPDDFVVSPEGIYEDDGVTLKDGKEQWCTTCHDDEAASSRPGPGVEVVVDNGDATFVCTWGTSTSGGYAGDYRWHAAGIGSCTATWTPNLPAADNYNVHAWWKADPNRATDSPYTIYYDGGSETIEVNQEIDGNQWNLLGSYPFAAGTSGYVVLSDDANEYVVADAIKLDNGSLEVSIYAPNVTGDNVDYGFYVTGHNINCQSCHDASKEHIDHEHRTYDVDDVTYAAINPYGDSYRLQVASNKASSTLCFVCHNSTEVLGASSSDVSHTNFWNNDSSIANSHWLHVTSFTGVHFDSDWDGEIDSTESCITCHNVHGSPTQAMIRHGELISTYGTTDKVPALNFAYLVPATEFDTASWTPDLAADTYSVYARWKADPNRATDSPYTIYYDGGSDTVEVNQQINGDQWNLLGTYPFAAGTSGYVELTDEGADGFVIADAIGWDTDGGAPDIVIDDGDAEFATVGDWTCPSGSGGYGDDYCYAKAAPEPDPYGTLADSAGGRMSYAGPSVAQNGVCWACHGPISYERAPYFGPKVLMGQAEPETAPNHGSGISMITVFVSDPHGDVSSVEIDLTPIGGSANQPMNDDGGGYYSYQVTIPDGTPDSPLTFEITAADAAMNTGEGEAKLTVIDSDSIYVDNADAAFVCDWGTSGTGGYRDDYRWHAAGTGSCTATWTPGLPAADTYNVYAWWKASSNRATDAPYTIYYDGGSQTVEVNQEIGGSQWNYLGNFSFAAGTSGYVVLSDDANEYVIADAIKLTPSPPPAPETVIVDNPDAQFVCYWGTSSSGGYNDYYRWHAAGTGSCTATWAPNLVAPSSYGVYAWWKAEPNRATDAPYTIYFDGGSATFDVNQEINGDQWNLLGTFPFDAGQSGYVVLSDDANEYVIADAIKFEP